MGSCHLSEALNPVGCDGFLLCEKADGRGTGEVRCVTAWKFGCGGVGCEKDPSSTQPCNRARTGTKQ